MKIKKIMQSGGVERFHSTPGITKQRNSEHQWGVALLCQHFTPDCRKEVILAAMTHDAVELITGDIPSPFKWSNKEIKPLLDKFERQIEKEWGINFELEPAEKFLLKICDMFEGMEYCIKRFKCGEMNAQIPFYAWSNHISTDYISINAGIIMTVAQEAFFNELCDEMKELGGKDGS